MLDGDGALCSCQPVLDVLFEKLIPCSQFFAHLIEESSSDIAEEVGRIASHDENWARPLVERCMADLMSRTPTREDLFRADLPTTRCIKAILVSSFNTTAKTLLRKRLRKLNNGSADVERQVSKLLDLLVAARWPSIISVCAEVIVQAAEGKFPGSGNTALVGIFWLRMLCPLILQQATKAPIKPSKQPKPSRLLEIVKVLQARANSFGSTEAASSSEDSIPAKIRLALNQLLSKSSPPQHRTPPDIAATQKLSQWISGHTVMIGRGIKAQGSGVFSIWLNFLSSLRDLASHASHAEEHQHAVEMCRRPPITISPSTASTSSSSSSSASSAVSFAPLSPRGGVMSDPEDIPSQFRPLTQSRSFPVLPINDDDHSHQPTSVPLKKRGSRLRIPTLVLKRRSTEEGLATTHEEELRKDDPRVESPGSDAHSEDSGSSSSSLQKDLGTVPVRYDRAALPPPFRTLQLNLTDIVNWNQEHLFHWLTVNDLEELIQPFRDYHIAGPEVLTLNKNAPVFAQTKQKIGLVKRFFHAQETLIRATIPVFESNRFSSDAEQILALKEFIFRLAHRFAGDSSW